MNNSVDIQMRGNEDMCDQACNPKREAQQQIFPSSMEAFNLQLGLKPGRDRQKKAACYLSKLLMAVVGFEPTPP